MARWWFYGSMVVVTYQQITSVAQPVSRSGSDELNLIDFPISLLQYQQPTDASGKRPDELVCKIESYDPDLDRIQVYRVAAGGVQQGPADLEDAALGTGFKGRLALACGLGAVKKWHHQAL